MIQTMQLNMSTKSSLIATSPIDYIEKAIKISAIGNHRNQILDELRKSSYRLFNDSSTINDWEEFFQRVVFL